MNRYLLMFSSVVFFVNIYAQSGNYNKLNYDRLNGIALSQDINTILQELDTATLTSEEDIIFKDKYENRFKYDNDKTDYFSKKDTTLNSINRIYQDYWRKSLLNNSTNYDKYFEDKLIHFFKVENQCNRYTYKRITKRTIRGVQKKYIKSKGYYDCFGFGKVGSLYDFLVCTKKIDTIYNVNIINYTIQVKVIFMTGFISLGWEEYATFGKSYPGGWTTHRAIYCVKESYDLKSEHFLVSYLKHEGQHFSDYKHYPKLAGCDLEYRAKLTELIFADSSLYSILGSFVYSAKFDKNNAHPYSAYCLIRDMSKLLFNNDFEKDFEKWKQVSKESIHEAAKHLFLQNTDRLNNLGKKVKSILI